MKVFISWSGDRSRAVADLLASWIPEVLQGVYCWVSNKDIEKGSIWFDEIQSTLSEVKAGILCVTRDNLHSPWLLFEAGALSKGLTRNRVIPLLIDLEPSDTNPPISQFNCSPVTKEDMLLVIQTLRKQRTDTALTDEQAKKAFNRCWPEFEEGFRKLKDNHVAPTHKETKRSSEDMIQEILEISRSLQRKLQSSENVHGLWYDPAQDTLAHFFGPQTHAEKNDENIMKGLTDEREKAREAAKFFLARRPVAKPIRGENTSEPTKD